jgi:hypothetical protein
MKTAKVLRVKTEASAHVVIRNGKGKKLFEINLPGVSITVAVSADANIQVDGVKNGK